jgi:hypothetical protein
LPATITAIQQESQESRWDVNWFRGLFGVALIVLVLGGISYVAYQAGADSNAGEVAAVTVAGTTDGESGVVIVRERGWGGGFHPLGFFGFLFVGLLLFALIKGLLFGAFMGGRHGGRREHWEARARETHDAWHRGDGGSSGVAGSGSGTVR